MKREKRKKKAELIRNTLNAKWRDANHVSAASISLCRERERERGIYTGPRKGPAANNPRTKRSPVEASPSSSSSSKEAVRICQSSCCKGSLRHAYQILPGGYTGAREAVATCTVEEGRWMSPSALRFFQGSPYGAQHFLWLTHAA